MNGNRKTATVRVLIADDERPIRLLCRVNLELEGMDVIEAADGAEAIELALASLPDVAVLDVAMPRLDGWQVAERLRGEPATEGIALVFLTAMTSQESQDRAREWNGIFVPKPFNPLELAAVVQRAFET